MPNEQDIHDLTMRYLKNQDISNLSISELAQKYTDIKDEFETTFRNQRVETPVQYI